MGPTQMSPPANILTATPQQTHPRSGVIFYYLVFPEKRESLLVFKGPAWHGTGSNLNQTSIDEKFPVVYGRRGSGVIQYFVENFSIPNADTRMKREHTLKCHELYCCCWLVSIIFSKLSQTIESSAIIKSDKNYKVWLKLLTSTSLTWFS